MTTEIAGHDPLIGRTLGHYCILEKIGSGGMGVVYRAHDEHLIREVAIKVLPFGTLADESSRRRFRNEALTLSKLNHPNIATVYDFDTQLGLDFLVMEYIQGVTLSDSLANASLPEKRVVTLGLQLAEGLSAAHAHGIVHRDLKPGNLRLSNEDRLKILDFGLAKLRLTAATIVASETVSEPHAMEGTLPYMAPEQVVGGEIDARTDIHAAGAVLYEMATGQRAFPIKDRAQLTSAILRSAPPSASSINPRLSAELARIIAKCLEKEPENRYQTSKELGIDLRRLERVLEGNSSTNDDAAVPHAGFLSRGRNRLVVAIAAIALLGAAAGFLGHKLAHTDNTPGAIMSIAVLPFSDLSPNHDQEYFSDGLTEEILNTLAKVPNLKVVGRTSSFKFKGKNEDLRVVGQELNVSHVLEGSVRKDGGHVRITAQLIKTKDGFHLWSDTYDRNVTDIFTLQDSIAAAVAAALQMQLGAEPISATGRSAEITKPEVFQTFLQARYFARLPDRGSSGKALEYATRAIQLDPSYARAYALRAEILLYAGGMTWVNYSDAGQRSLEDATKAIELDPRLPDGYRVVSRIQAEYDSNCPMAEKSMKKALELSPTDSETLALGGVIAACQGRLEEALGLTQQALMLDPLRPVELTNLAQYLGNLGRYEEAHMALERALDLSPHDAAMMHEVRGEIYLEQGRPKEALGEMEKEPAGYLHELGLSLAYFALGSRKQSDEALAKLISQYQNAAAYQIAQAYAYRGETDQAFRWLRLAFELHDPGLLWFKTDLKLKSLRGDARYAELLRRMNLS